MYDLPCGVRVLAIVCHKLLAARGVGLHRLKSNMKQLSAIVLTLSNNYMHDCNVLPVKWTRRNNNQITGNQ